MTSPSYKLTSAVLAQIDATPIVVATHPRSGTHLLIDSLRRNFPPCSIRKWPLERFDRLYLTAEAMMQRHSSLSPVMGLRTLARARRPIVKTHALPEFAPWYMPAEHRPLAPVFRDWFQGRGRFVSVHRDGRAAVWSFYVLLRASGVLGSLSFGSFLRSGGVGSVAANAAVGWADHVRAWMNYPDVLVVTFDELIKRPLETLARIGEHADAEPRWADPVIPVPVRTGLEYRLGRLRGGRPLSTAILPPHGASDSRKWHEVFSYDDCVFFERETSGLLVELGYATDSDWPDRWRDGLAEQST